jgi:alkylation response protein AidB-like acyl-CoA dehydrogenase
MIELQEIRTLARDFARAELRPHVERWDHDSALDDSVVAQLAELGFFGMLVPESDGGMGFDVAAYGAALEELAWGEPATALVVLVQQVVAAALAHADADVRERFLGPLAAGDTLACYALSTGDDEPTLHARVDGAAWRISGAAPWVLHTGRPALALVRAATDHGAGLFVIPLDGDGARFGDRAATLGLRPVSIAALVLEEAAATRIDDAALAPAVRAGRLGVAAVSIGIAQAALDHARDYANQREQFSTKLRLFDAIRFKLADMMVRIAAARALLLEAATSDSELHANIAKVFASDAAMHVTTEAVQVFGGYGYMRDYPVEKLMRDAKAMALLQGADERLRLDIADTLYQD